MQNCLVIVFIMDKNNLNEVISSLIPFINIKIKNLPEKVRWKCNRIVWVKS